MILIGLKIYIHTVRQLPTHHAHIDTRSVAGGPPSLTHAHAISLRVRKSEVADFPQLAASHGFEP